MPIEVSGTSSVTGPLHFDVSAFFEPNITKTSLVELSFENCRVIQQKVLLPDSTAWRECHFKRFQNEYGLAPRT